MPNIFHAVPCAVNDSDCHWDGKAWAKAVFDQNALPKSSENTFMSKQVRLRQKTEQLRLSKGIAAIESIFVLYRITGDDSWRDAVWNMFQAITQQPRTEYGYSCIEDVTQLNSKKTDKMEIFWMAETLKYMWLLFEDPNVVSLDESVFNTEAHPFRLPKK